MTPDIIELLCRLKLYIGVPLTASEQAVANKLYADVVAQCKSLQQECRVAQIQRQQASTNYEGPRT